MQEQKGEGETRGHFEEKVDRKPEIEAEHKNRGGAQPTEEQKTKIEKVRNFKAKFENLRNSKAKFEKKKGNLSEKVGTARSMLEPNPTQKINKY